MSSEQTPQRCGTGAISGDPSVPGDSLRKIRELANKATTYINNGRPVQANVCLLEIRELCSHENSTATETR